MKSFVSPLPVIVAAAAALGVAAVPTASATYLNVYGEELQSCSSSGQALTGYLRNGSCTALVDDGGSHHICIDLSSTSGGGLLQRDRSARLVLLGDALPPRSKHAVPGSQLVRVPVGLRQLHREGWWVRQDSGPQLLGDQHGGHQGLQEQCRREARSCSPMLGIQMQLGLDRVRRPVQIAKPSEVDVLTCS